MVRNNPIELQPKIEIFNQEEVLQYKFETDVTGTYATNTTLTSGVNFTVTDCVIREGVGSEWGTCILMIDDRNNDLTKSGSTRKESVIERQWIVKVQLGKTLAGLDNYFWGKVIETEILRPATNSQKLLVTCVGWGDMLRNRYSKMVRNQNKEADGITLDDTDNDVRIDELIFDLIHGVDHQISEEILPLTAMGIPGLVTYMNFHKELLDFVRGTHGTQGGTETYSNGLYGKKYGNRSGQGEQITLQSESSFDFMGKDTTWSIMIRLSGSTSVANEIYSKRAGVGNGITLDIDASNDLIFSIDGNATKTWTYTSSGGTNVRDGNSHSVIVTWDGGDTGGTLLMYIDGSLVSTTPSGSFSIDFQNNESFKIGDTIANTPNFDFEEFRIYNTLLTAGNADSLHNEPFRSESSAANVCPSCLDILLPNVNLTYSSYASAMSRLLGLGNVPWRIDEDRAVVAHDPNSHDSGILFTNDIGSTEEQNWDATKIGYLLDNPITWTDSAAGTLYNFLHGVGTFTPVLDVEYGEIAGELPDASDNLDDMWHAIPFTTINDDIYKFAIRGVKTGVPIGPAEVWVVGSDASNEPNTNDVRKVIKLGTGTLNRMTSTVPAPWFEIPVKPRLQVAPNEKLWLVFKKFGTASNTFNINYESTAPTDTTNFWDSATGAAGSFVQSSGNSSAIRVYSGQRVEITIENVEATAKLGVARSKLIPLRADLETDTAEQALLAASEVLSKSNRKYSSVLVSAPDTKPEIMKFCKIVDVQTGLTQKANIMGMTIEMHADETGKFGTDRYTVDLEDFFL